MARHPFSLGSVDIFQHNQGGLSTILSRAINFCWFCFKWSLVLAVVAGGAAALHFYQRIDNEICRQIEAKIAKHYSHLKVSIGSAQRVEGKGIVVRDFAIEEPGAEGPRANLLSVKEIFLECQTDLQTLACKDPDVRRVTFRQPVFHTTRRPDGSFSTSHLLPPPHFGDIPPEVVVENGVVELFDPLRSPAGTMVLRDLNLTLQPASQGLPATSEDIRQFQGMFVNNYMRQVEFRGAIDLVSNRYTTTGNLEGLDLCPEFYASLPQPLATQLDALHDLRGQSTIHFTLANDPGTGKPLQFDLSGKLERGRWEDARLPHPLIDIQTNFHVDNSGYSISDFFARSNKATMRGNYCRTGFESNGPIALTAEVRQFELDRNFINLLPTALQDQLHVFNPSGLVDADVKLDYDGRTWKKDLSIQCVNVSFTYRKFLYPLEYGKGSLVVKNDKLNLNLVAYAGNQPVTLTAEVEHLDSNPTGSFEAKAADIQVDRMLLDALPENTQKIVRSLDPRGSVHIYAKLWRDRPTEPIHQHLRIIPNGCSLRYEKFPYPVGNVSGTIEMIDQNWSFTDLEGKHNGGTVRCKGQIAPGLQGNELTLNFTGTDVVLEEELRDALSSHIRQVWQDIKPRGVIDLAVELHYLFETEQLRLTVQAEPQPKTTSIEPTQFPYRLENLQGLIIYRDGQVTLEHCKAEHGIVKISYEGECNFQPDGRWNMRFTGLTIDKLRPDRELLQALPERVTKALMVLNLTAPINLRGNLSFENNGGLNQPLNIRWDLNIGLQQASIRCGSILFENINGIVGILGGFDGRKTESRGELNLDSVNYKDCLFTQVKGPLWIEDTRVLFGNLVDRNDGPDKSNGMTGMPRTPAPITSAVFGGVLYSDGWVLFGSEPRFGVGLSVNNADLASCSQELAGGHHKVQGKVQGTLSLTGSGSTRSSLAGRGILNLHDAYVYELPMMISMLKLLSIRPPDPNAFSSATINYRIEGEHVYFERIDFNGDAISLRGNGQMDFQTVIDLNFYAKLGRGELELPVVSQVLNTASRQAMAIKITGTLEKPTIDRQALPGLNQALQQFQNDVQNRK